MRILRNYILKECLVPFILSLVLLTCVFLLGNLIQLANMVINKGVSLVTIGRVFCLMIPVLLGYTIPIACLIAVILGFSRLSADNEIIALRAGGVHLGRVLVPILVLGVIISLGTLLLNERVIPYAHHEQRKALKNLGTQNPTAMLEAGLFITAFKGQILFIHKIDGNKLYNVNIYQPQPNGPTRTIIAKRGEFTPVPGKDQIKLKLMNGTSDEPNLDNPDTFYKLNFQNYFITLDLSQKDKKVDKKPKGMTLKELKEKMREFRAQSMEIGRLQTEYFRKITWSFSPLMFMALGFPLAVITHRREKSANVFLAIVCAASYYVISLGCEALSIKEIVPPAWIMWTPNFIAGLTAFILNYKCVS